MLSLDDHIATQFRQLHHCLHAQEKVCKAWLEEEGGALLRETEERLQMLRKACQVDHELLLEAQGQLEDEDPAVFLKVRRKRVSMKRETVAHRQTPNFPTGDNSTCVRIYLVWSSYLDSLHSVFQEYKADNSTGVNIL